MNGSLLLAYDAFRTAVATMADIVERDIWEVANQLLGYVSEATPKHLAEFLIREGKEAAKLAEEIERLRTEHAEAIRQARAEALEEAAQIADDSEKGSVRLRNLVRKSGVSVDALCHSSEAFAAKNIAIAIRAKVTL